MTRSKPERLVSTPLSDFIRNATVTEKTRVYGEVMRRVTERQNELLARYEERLRKREHTEKD